MADIERYPSKRDPWETGTPSVIAMRTYDRFTDNTVISIDAINIISRDQLGKLHFKHTRKRIIRPEG